MLAAIATANVIGARGQRVTLEVHVGPGLPGFSIVGLPDEACRESRDRVRAALLSSGLPWPQHRVTVNLAPGHVRKSGSGLDLALAIGLLVATGVIEPGAVAGLGFLGELGLDGSVRAVAGAAPMVSSLDDVVPVVPAANAGEAAAVAPQGIRAIERLADAVHALRGDEPWPPPPTIGSTELRAPADLADVRGQPFARLAIEVAAAGRHHLLLVGPPGSGKSMLAARLPGVLPPLEPDQVLEATLIHSAAGLPGSGGGVVRQPPFRAPHHTSSMVAMVGGGTASLRPGEISLAHTGVLFLDELGEFAPTVLDALRQPLEDREVRIARARTSVTMPADVLLVGASNPCPCGGGRPGTCSCSPAAQQRYLRRLSGPFLDRFDLRIAVDRPNVDELLDHQPAEASADVRARVVRARQRAVDRGVAANSAIPAGELDAHAPLTDAALRTLRAELERGRLSGRGLHRVRRVARTLADLAGGEHEIDDSTVRVALSLRLDLRAGSAVAI